MIHPSLPTRDDLAGIVAGTHERLWDVLGAHHDPTHGTAFAVWAPHARGVSVVGDWNDWAPGADPLARDHLGAGVWSGVLAAAGPGSLYKLAIEAGDGTVTLRTDPMAQAAEPAPGNASLVCRSTHVWGDGDWMAARGSLDPAQGRISTYEVHLGSWRRGATGAHLGYREIAPMLAEHVTALGFTHVELLPVAEHPFDPSWGYQVTGYYAPTARFGTPDDFRWFVDHLHQHGIGVIVDWVPAHFPKDAWALARFDGTELYEHADPWRAEHPDWGTLEFDLTKPEVRCFLVCNALYWFGELHVDGIRVDAVASMLYLDYSRGPGEWEPNHLGTNHDLDAVSFLQELNTVVHRVHPGVLTIAEESTAWDGVSRGVDRGGLGFTHKWNLGWMHDTLGYWSTPPAERPAEHNKLTFGLTYAFAEHFVLPLSHDEVVHLKRPLLGKMPGDSDEERFDHLRSLFAWMWAHPGKQLLFMGAELAEEREWSQDRELDWSLLERPLHAGVRDLLATLNDLQSRCPALHRGDHGPAGFRWLVVEDRDGCTFAFVRTDPVDGGRVAVVANLSDHPCAGYRLALTGEWSVVLTTADPRFGGAGPITSAQTTDDGHVALDLPARSVIYLVPSEPAGG